GCWRSERAGSTSRRMTCACWSEASSSTTPCTPGAGGTPTSRRARISDRVDLRRIYLLQAVRAIAYGFGSVILGVSLAHSGLSSAEVGLVLASLLAGSALASILLVRRADRLGRRRVYGLLYALMAVAGALFALTSSLPWLILAGLTGTLSVDVQESGPFTSLEQAMIPEVAGRRTTHVF